MSSMCKCYTLIVLFKNLFDRNSIIIHQKHETEINMFRYSGTNQGFWVELYRPKLSVSTRDIPLWVIDYDFDAKR